MEDFNKPSTLSFKDYNTKISIKMDRSDVTIGEFYENCKQLALAVGYAPKIVNKYFTQE